MSDVQPVPEGYNTISSYLVVPDCVEAMKIYAQVFGAVEKVRFAGPNGQGTSHAEMQIGSSMLMMTDENPHLGYLSPQTLGDTGVYLFLYVDDADATFAAAKTAGFTPMVEMMDAFWGDRFGKLKDPYGHIWALASRQEDLSMEDIAQRMKA